MTRRIRGCLRFLCQHLSLELYDDTVSFFYINVLLDFVVMLSYWHTVALVY